MLVLSRNANQEICIGNDITIRVVGIQGNKVRLAISAPSHVRIVRGELVKRLSELNLQVGHAAMNSR